MVLPYGIVLSPVAQRGIYASLSEAQPSGTPLTVDVKRNGTSILNVKLTFDNGERSTLTAALPPTLVPGGDILPPAMKSPSMCSRSARPARRGCRSTWSVRGPPDMSARIYDRPDLDQRQRLPPLFVTGNLPKAPPMVAYEGRLEIHNGIGGCTVRQIDGDRLPPGHRLYVDQAAKQVVLAWPAYQAGAAPIINPGFESGPTGGIPVLVGDRHREPADGLLGGRLQQPAGRVGHFQHRPL
ncbi:hypothetical protein SNK04_014143 [Fusarium graminearum]